MGTRRGLYYVCDRCGKSMFEEEPSIRSLEKDELYGGAKDWDYIYPERKVMHGKLLCPECGKLFDITMRKFMNQEI